MLETEFIVEVVDPATGEAVPPGTEGELVVTNLGRSAVRYCATAPAIWSASTRSRVRAAGHWARLNGGVRGRVDDMIVLRGNNVHPSALQTILHRFAEVAEYRIEVDRAGALPVLRIDVETHPARDGGAVAVRVAQAVRDELLFRAEVRAVAPGTLPRFEHKAQRFVRNSCRMGVAATDRDLIEKQLRWTRPRRSPPAGSIRPCEARIHETPSFPAAGAVRSGGGRPRRPRLPRPRRQGPPTDKTAEAKLANWSDWRGPAQNGWSPEHGLPDAFVLKKDDPNYNLLWSAPATAA